MWLAFLQICIFSLTTYLMLLLYSIPFVYKFNRKSHFALRATAVLLSELLVIFVASFLETLFYYYVFSFETVYIEAGRVIIIIIIFLLYLGALFIIFNEKNSQILYAAVGAMAAQLIASAVYSLIINVTGSNSVLSFLIATEESPVDIYSVLFYPVSVAAVFILLFLFFGRPFARMYGEYAKEINTYILIIFLAMLCMAMFYQNNTFIFYNENKASHNAIHILLISYCLTILFVERFMLYWVKDNRETEAIKNFHENYKRQGLALQQQMELVNIKCHDLKHQISNILDGADIDGKYVSEVEKTISIYDAYINTGNEQLDVVLTEKSLRCELNGIELTVMLDGAALSFMSPSDISSFFGNALDNAIEYLISREEKTDRFIHISSHKNGRFLSVRIENYCSHPPEIDEKGFPVTTKSDKANHGFGVRSMFNVVEEYDGVLSYKSENNLFVLSALFCV